MAVIETFGGIPPTADTIAYTDYPAPAPVDVRDLVPEVWYDHACYEQLSSTNSSVNAAGYLQVVYTGSVGNTLPIKVGDVLEYGSVQGNITSIALGATTRITTDIPYVVIAINQACWVAYINRQELLTPITVSTSVASYEPQRIGQLRSFGTVSAGGVTTAYYYNASSFARSQFKRPQRPVMDDEIDLSGGNPGYGAVPITISMGLIGDSLVEFPIVVTNATTYKDGTISQQSEGSTAIAKWKHRLYGCVQAPTYQRVGGTYIGGPQVGPAFSYAVNPNHILVCWLNRYGAPEMLPFGYLNQEGFDMEVMDTYRQGYQVRNLASVAADTLAITTGLIHSRYREWFEDLQTSPWVFVAQDYKVKANAEGTVTYIDVDNTDWQEYRIMPGSLQTKSANNTLMNIVFNLTKVQERITYTN